MSSFLVYTVEPLYYGHPWDHMKCPDKRGIRILEVVLYTSLCSWDIKDLRNKETSLTRTLSTVQREDA